MTSDLDHLFPPENQFIAPVTVYLSADNELKLRKFINLHYLGDENANELVDGNFVAKYPEKETEEFKNAVANASRGFIVDLSVVFNEKGIPSFSIVEGQE